MQELVEPAPQALTMFEVPGAARLWRVEAYFADAPDETAVRRSLVELIGEPVPAFAAEAVPDRNWVALSQAALPPVHAGRFTVYGSHDRLRVARGPSAIRIEAGEAFGTAHHATTYGCLLAISQLSRQRHFQRVLDLGCGSGILAIAAARVWPAALIAGVDIDRRSVAVAGENAADNGVGRRIRFAVGGVAAPLARGLAPFDLVLANILARPLIALAPAIRRAVAPGAVAVLSGLLNHEAPAVIAAYRAQGFVVAGHARHDGWSALTLIKRAVAGARRGA